MPHTNRRTHHIFHTHPTNEQGQTIAEYALLVAFIAVVVAVVLPLFGSTISGLFNPVVSALGG
ncbi:MAG TPA: Flp family type IVb pilin, partial [Gaiellaceae bacterium]|nr:Flp family type IVb pilin [Gaiellaceae bacterium]